MALTREAKPIPGMRAWVTIHNGKFEVQCPFNPESKAGTLITDDPEEARAFLQGKRAETIFCSSSVDFPEEYGMAPAKVRQLLGEDFC